MSEYLSALQLGGDASNLGLGEILLRSAIVFFYLLVLLRVAKRRFLAERSPLDVLLTFLLASMISRAINGSAPLQARWPGRCCSFCCTAR